MSTSQQLCARQNDSSAASSPSVRHPRNPAGSCADERRVAVLGGGITGLTAAWYLQRAGFSPVVYEKSGRSGGAIATLRREGWLHELGPNSLLEGSDTVTSFLDDVGLGARRLYAAPAAKQRYIERDGRLCAM